MMFWIGIGLIFAACVATIISEYFLCRKGMTEEELRLQIRADAYRNLQDARLSRERERGY